MITKNRIREILKDHAEHPIPELGGLNYYSTFMDIVFENTGVKNYTEWDYGCTEEYRLKAFKKAHKLIKDALHEN